MGPYLTPYTKLIPDKLCLDVYDKTSTFLAENRSYLYGFEVEDLLKKTKKLLAVKKILKYFCIHKNLGT